MLVWILVILLKCLPEKRWILHTKNEQEKCISNHRKNYIYKKKEKEGILYVAGAFYTMQGIF